MREIEESLRKALGISYFIIARNLYFNYVKFHLNPFSRFWFISKNFALQTNAHNAEAGLDRKEEKVKNGIFREFWPIFRYFSDTPLNFTDIFAATDISTYL